MRHVVITFAICLLVATSVCLAAGDEWVKKANMPTARDSLSISVVDGKIYAIGGFLNGTVGVGAVEEYDPATDTWTEKGKMPVPSGLAAAGVVNGKIYYIGGFINWNQSLNTVWIYDPVADSWEEGTTMQVPRDCAAAECGGWQDLCHWRRGYWCLSARIYT